MKILVAEDEPIALRLMEAALTKLGHEAVLAVDGLEAWRAFQKEYFPMVISDRLMPGMDGLALCRAIRSLPREKYTFIIMLTTLGGKANYLDALQAGADDFITKPFDAEQLAARLGVAERILGLRKHVRNLEGLLPICSYCKKIRDEKNAWVRVEEYITARSFARFSHSICPECTKLHFNVDDESETG